MNWAFMNFSIFIFLTSYFRLRCVKFIENIFEDFDNELKDDNQHRAFYEKFKNAGIYTFYSEWENCFLKDLIELNELIDLGDILYGDYLYFYKRLFCFPKYLDFSCDEILSILDNFLDKFVNKPIEETDEISDITNFSSQKAWKAKKSILIKRPSQTTEFKNSYFLGSKKRSEWIAFVSNFMLDTNIALIILKSLCAYRRSIGSTNERFYNFMILNFKDLDSKKKFNEKITNFYRNFYSSIISHFIFAEFEDSAVSTPSSENSRLPDFKIRCAFHEDNYCTQIQVFKEKLELTHYRKDNNWIISKRPRMFLKLYNNIHYTNRNFFFIYSHIFATSIKIICETFEECLIKENPDKKIFSRVSVVSILCNEEIIQKIKVVSFYNYENGEIKLSEEIKNHENTLNAILLTEDMYKKFKDNIFLFLNPGIDVFCKFIYKNHDFLTSDYIFINRYFKTYRSMPFNSSIIKAYEKTTKDITNFIKSRSDKYEIYYFDVVNQLESNLKSEFLYHTNDFYKSLSNSTSFKKRKYNDHFIRKKLENLDEIIILFENKIDKKDSIYVHLEVGFTIYQFIYSTYVKILKAKIADLSTIDNFIYQLNLPPFHEKILKKEIIKVVDIFLKKLPNCNDIYKFRFIIIENVKNMRGMELYIHKIVEDMVGLLPLYYASIFKIACLYLFKLNKSVYEETIGYLDIIFDEIFFFINTFTSGFYYIEDLFELGRYISSGCWKY